MIVVILSVIFSVAQVAASEKLFKNFSCGNHRTALKILALKFCAYLLFIGVISLVFWAQIGNMIVGFLAGIPAGAILMYFYKYIYLKKMGGNMKLYKYRLKNQRKKRRKTTKQKVKKIRK